MSECKVCEESLFLQLEEDSGQTIPDDVALRCGCHLHWQCLMDDAQLVASSLTCPCCLSSVITDSSHTSDSENQPVSMPSILVAYNNEGGFQSDLDIYSLLREEAYIQDHPEVVPARAFHVMCAEGDVEGLLEFLLHTEDESIDIENVIRYQDPLSSMKSGLHSAVENDHEAVVWLLLWISSTFASASFPTEVQQMAASISLDRLPVAPRQDIRSLRDVHGRTPGALAQDVGGSLQHLVEIGALTT